VVDILASRLESSREAGGIGLGENGKWFGFNGIIILKFR
jgi:hypothetical protein